MSDHTPIPPGRYRHFKGGQYVVIGPARHSETREEMILYRPDYGDRGLWVRPARMFSETVMHEGREVPRFRRLESPGGPAGDGVGNLFDDLPRHLPDELVGVLARAGDVRIERIVSHGHASPDGFWYDQDQHEWVVVLRGAARLRIGDEVVGMTAGSYINIPARRRHRVEWTTPDEPTVWLAVFHGGAE